MKSDLSFYRKRAVVLLYVEERKVLLYHFGKVMRKDNKGGAAVCKINCPNFIHGGLLSSKSGVYPLRRRTRGEVLFAMNGEPLLLCGALRNVDNLCFLA